MTYIKKHIPEIIALTGALFIIVFFIWAFSQHGTIGLFRVNGFFKMVFIIFGIYGLILFFLGLSYLWLKIKRNFTKTGWLSVIITILALPAVIVPPVAFSVLSGVFSPRFIDTPPQLLLTSNTGDYGVPDMAVYFTTADAVSGSTLIWGDDKNSQTLSEDKESNQHIFIMKDLKPDTHYHYRINNGEVADFSTPSIDGHLRFVIASDAHYGSPYSRNDLREKMLYEIADPDNGFDMFFFLGDLVEYGFNDNEWDEAFRSFNTANSIIPTSYAAGNHDTLFSGLNNYLNYCLPEGLDAKTESRLWYRIDIDDIHFLVLDMEWSAETYTKAQADWLEQQLKDIPEEDWTIILSHGFYYASGIFAYGWEWYDNQETIDSVTPLFNEYRVDLVCSGHAHNVELLEENGVTYAVCGAFGCLPDPGRTYTSPASIWYTDNQSALLDITVNEDLCSLTFRDSDFETLYTVTFDKNR